MSIAGRHEKSPNVKTPKNNQNRDLSGPDSLLQESGHREHSSGQRG